ncbi:hypothetical protein F5Y18DRAFT_374925 [Xylariaceae sp. FL1019]|nr:hypothetical protein F5Y18DRAFT_374925 [Xylariaceae sp. FL1019]
MVDYTCTGCGKTGYGLQGYEHESELSTMPIPAHDHKVTIKAILMYRTEDNRTFGQSAILKGRVHRVNTETTGEVMVLKGVLYCQKKIKDQRMILRGYLCQSSTNIDGKEIRVKGCCRLAIENKKTLGGVKDKLLDKLLTPFRRNNINKKD